MRLLLINNKKNEKLSPNFNSGEFACKCGRRLCNVSFISEDLLEALEALRAYFNAPVSINSGYRCIEHNQRIGGSENSRHTHGLAVDIVIKGQEPAAVYDYLNSRYPGGVGLGNYKTFTHFDVRPEKARW